MTEHYDSTEATRAKVAHAFDLEDGWCMTHRMHCSMAESFPVDAEADIPGEIDES